MSELCASSFQAFMCPTVCPAAPAGESALGAAVCSFVICQFHSKEISPCSSLESLSLLDC